MNVVQIISSEGFYGAESLLLALSCSLLRLGCSVNIAVFRDPRGPDSELTRVAEAQGFSVIDVECRGRLDWNTIREIRRIGEACEATVFHAHGYKADIYTFAALRKRDVALVSTCHNWPSRKPIMQAYAKADRAILCRFDHVTAPSTSVLKTLYRSGITTERCTYIPNGVDLARFTGNKPRLREELGIGQRPLVGFVGRHVEDKGGASLLRAAQQVLRVCPDARFVFIGDGPCREPWRLLAVQLGIEKQAYFTGKVKDTSGAYASLDLLVLPSLAEAMPMCLLEGMAAGIPVIATGVGSIPELITNDMTGVLVQPGNTLALAQQIIRLLQDRPAATALGDLGRRRVHESFSADAMAKKYMSIYEQAARAKFDPTRSVFARCL